MTVKVAIPKKYLEWEYSMKMSGEQVSECYLTIEGDNMLLELNRTERDIHFNYERKIASLTFETTAEAVEFRLKYS